ncbi:MFS transporter [Kibdelosporangium aridum]|uniref:Predicted arabinose efflux permease, MFS family n=1 Tax=Kibdelosporangium aridum TaxID=2030 RepID=A0A1W2FGE0_KIBAR|nr:MFS transporter [Kibdelosporangium aridum]SMD20746.1 Predicted arabinose efflux permease, MFS family [Kibdelosporangium aridum]
MTITDTAAEPKTSLWTAQYRAVSIGMTLLVTLVAFENLGVNTAMPRMVADLRGGELYSWPFTVFLVTSLIANVLAGRLCDRRGPAFGLYTGVILFMAGLLVAGLAQSMWMLLIGRALQGLGGGTISIAIYVMIAYVYPERVQPAAFGILSAAWVLPSLVGPAAAGLLTEHASWRWVFLGLVPLALLGALLLLPAVRTLPARVEQTGPVRGGLVPAAIAAALGIAALTWAAEHPSLATILLGLAGLAMLLPSLFRLLPKGTLAARPGLPVTILARGLLAGAYTAIEVYVTLTLTAVHGYSPVLAGLPLTVGALAWSAAAVLPARNPDVDRLVFVRWGFTLLAAGALGMLLVTPTWGWGWISFAAWIVASAGMGLGYSSLSVLTMRYSSLQEQGANAAALQVSERVFSAVLVGLGGVLLALLASPQRPSIAMAILDVAMAVIAVIGVVLVRPGRR